MNQPTFDADGYPTEQTLEAIEKWPINDPSGLFYFIYAAWNHRYGLFKYLPESVVLATGGWSGNEAIIEAMQENKVLWIVLWESSHRGGKYVLRLPEATK